MKKTILLTIALLVTVCFHSCKKPITYCGAEDPTEISWIKEMIAEKGDKVTVYEITYNGKEGFFWIEQFDHKLSELYYNTCDNTNIYHATIGGVVGYMSNFPDDFPNVNQMKKIYPK